jgi:hypothetical protein
MTNCSKSSERPGQIAHHQAVGLEELIQRSEHYSISLLDNIAVITWQAVPAIHSKRVRAQQSVAPAGKTATSTNCVTRFTEEKNDEVEDSLSKQYYQRGSNARTTKS